MRTHSAMGLAATIALLVAGSVATLEWPTTRSTITRRARPLSVGLDESVGPPRSRSPNPSPGVERRRRRALEHAAARLERVLGIPIVLPSSLPHGTRLDPKYGMEVSPRGRDGEIVLRVPAAPYVGRIPLLWIQYGVATFDGCGGDNAMRTTVGNAPAVFQHFFSNGRFTGVTVLWPAREDHPQGRYGLSGPFSTATMFRWAEEMGAARRARAAARPALEGC